MSGAHEKEANVSRGEILLGTCKRKECEKENGVNRESKTSTLSNVYARKRLGNKDKEA